MSSSGQKTLAMVGTIQERNDTEDLKALITAARIRNSNNAVASMLMLASQLPQYPGPRTRFTWLNRFLARLQAAHRAFMDY